VLANDTVLIITFQRLSKIRSGENLFFRQGHHGLGKKHDRYWSSADLGR